MDIGIVGCGAIGSEIAKAAVAMDGIGTVRIHDIDPDALAELAKTKGLHAVTDVAELVDESHLVIECANKAVVQTVLPEALQAGKSVMVLTVGALADRRLRDALLDRARKGGGKVYVPSGAVMGVDGLRAAAEAELKSVTLVTTKPNEGLDRKLDKWTLLWSGKAGDAVKEFPKNVNVAATLSLAGLGFEQTYVQVAVDPLATRNSHKVIIEGDFGRARIEVENLPSPNNPRTSHLASLSAIAMLRRILSPIEVGG